MFDDAIDAFLQIFTPPFRATLWKSLGLTIGLLVAAWVALDRFAGSFIRVELPWLATTLQLLLGIGLVVGLAFLIAPVTSLVAGFFLDDMAAIVERAVDPDGPAGTPAPAGAAALFVLRFAGLSLVVNLVALALLFAPVVNVVAFLGANGYLLGRESSSSPRCGSVPPPRRARCDGATNCGCFSAGWSSPASSRSRSSICARRFSPPPS